MVKSMRRFLESHIENISWMDDLTKVDSLQNLQELKSVTGFVEETDREDVVETMYGKLSIGGNHLKNFVILKKHFMEISLSHFGKMFIENK